MNRGYRKSARAAQKQLIRATLSFAWKGAAVVIVAMILLIALYPRMCLWRAERQCGAGHFEEAMEILSRLDPEDNADLLARGRYQVAVGYMNTMDYDAALALFAQMEDYEDSAVHMQECRYQKAAIWQGEGRYEDAARQFYAISGYNDAMDRYYQCRVAMAEAVYTQGDGIEAIRMLLAIGTQEAQKRAGEIAMEMTGDETLAQSLLSGSGYTAEQLAEVTRLSTARSHLKTGRIAVGDGHTVGVTNSGQVLAAGDNSSGQCDVGHIAGATQAACGAKHTVVLKSDGTVTAVGDNSRGQCNVEQWTNVVQIACGAYDTMGLLADGTVISTGMHDYKGMAAWHEVSQISGGSYMAACVYGGGAMAASHDSGALTQTDLVQVSVNTACAAGVRLDGTAAATFAGLEDWNDLVYISVSSTGVLGLKSDGTVCARFFRQDAAIDVSTGGRVVAIAAGSTHSALLMGDGTVICRGSNEFGQCEVSSWRLAD